MALADPQSAVDLRPRRNAPGLLLQFVANPRPVVWGVAAGSWALALTLTLTDRAQLLGHDTLATRPEIPWPLAIVLFLVAWQLMVGAMMLPTSIPMIQYFARVSSRQSRAGPALITFLAAYIAIWTGFAFVALAGDTGLHWLFDRWAWLQERPWVIFSLALVIAGAFQFSPLKDRCLHECRHPMSFLLHYYQRGLRAAWGIGLRHGLYCLGCCWALMLVMFAAGVGNLAWMAALTGVMLLEKTSLVGRRFVPVIGIILISWGLLVGLRGLLMSQ